nr:hypothetical protein [Tanacetum cinerariifolium]
MQTKTSNTLHNAIMEAGSKDRPPMLASGIDNDIYSTFNACLNVCEMWKAIERLKQGESINVQDLKTNLYWEFRKFTSQDGESLESYYSRFYKMMNELIRNQCKVTNPQVNVQFLLQLQPEWQRSQQAATRNRGKTIVNSSQLIYVQEPLMVAEDDETNGNVAGARETVGSYVVQKSGIQCYNCKEFGHVARECQKPKREKDAAYHREKMLLYQELEAHYMYMAQLQEVSPDDADSGPIFDDEPLQKVSNDDHHNVFALENVHPEQSKSVHDTYPIKQDAQNVIINSLDMNYDRGEIDQNDDDNDLAKERKLNKVFIEKLKGEIEDFKNKNKSLESSNNFFKEANNRLSETNNLLYADYKKSEAELARRNSMEYASQMELKCAKVRGDFLSYKMDYQKSCNKYSG